jgi:hypothetical protein
MRGVEGQDSRRCNAKCRETEMLCDSNLCADTVQPKAKDESELQNIRDDGSQGPRTSPGKAPNRRRSGSLNW